jgi:hypothetical protein
MRARKAIPAALMLIAASIIGQSAAAKDKSGQDMIRTFPAPVDKVYAAAVQVVSADYNLKAVVRRAIHPTSPSGRSFIMH